MLAAVLFAFFSISVAACREREAPPATPPDPTSRATALAGQPARPSGAATVTPTPTASQTRQPTATPTITPTPTATAPLAILDGDPLASAAQSAAPQAGAPCGVVDLLDFPLDPPDALNISRGGQDFNVFRNRFDGYHAGEDWWGPGGRSGSFGEPVYSIGHGQVTFAHPFGWGVDQGTVILRHVYPDGREFYSFYGHLDPPSIELSYGQCVTRGQKVGEIGRPRGSPHLHFEMRYHTPSDPGPGYWSHDPRRSGWLAPSHTIWSWRIGVSPGVVWQRADLAPGLQGIALLPSAALLATEGPDVVAFGMLDGAQQWRLSSAGPLDEEETLPAIAATALDVHAGLLYTADRRGRIAALALPSEGAQGEDGALPAPQLAWDLQLHNVRGTPTLFPLPSGGVALAMDGRLIAFSPAGAILWRQPFDARPISWNTWQDQLFVSASDDEATLLQISATGLLSQPAIASGKLVASGSGLFLYDGKAVYRLDGASQQFEPFYELPDGLFSQSDMLALPDGGLLLAHMDSGDRRLIALDAGGALRWQRAYGSQLDGAPRLLLAGDQTYLFSMEESGSWSRVFLHRVDLQSERLTLVFSGGTRTPLPGGTWAFGAESGQFLINIGGGSLLALDVASALQVVCAGSTSPGC